VDPKLELTVDLAATQRDYSSVAGGFDRVPEHIVKHSDQQVLIAQ
jgi:hypothetical protein